MHNKLRGGNNRNQRAIIIFEREPQKQPIT
ncbi:MAG: hypothetical protein ACI8ZM_002690 [Crocinitomix sp.]|jgi:hypothetical protein